MKRIAMAIGLAVIVSHGASAQTSEQLVKGATDTSNVLNYGMGYNLNRFSTLDQINKDTVKNLVPVWNYSFADDRSEESQPLVYQGVIYVTTHSATMAVDVKTGKQIWKTKVEYPPETPRDRLLRHHQSRRCAAMTARYSAPPSTPMSSRSTPRPARSSGVRRPPTSRKAIP